ncbi:MAG: hypothetical protein M5U19_04225 [Microthrixaceae bacterium]|nr:hypothetical protein [Microthrixaceae bacterium]
MTEDPATRRSSGRGAIRSGGWESTAWSSAGRDRSFGRVGAGSAGASAASTGGLSKPTPPSGSGAHLLGIAVGDDVTHAKWGEGVVLHLEGVGDKTEVVVRFPEKGEKRLLLAWAPLEKVDAPVADLAGGQSGGPGGDHSYDLAGDAVGDAAGGAE